MGRVHRGLTKPLSGERQRLDAPEDMCPLMGPRESEDPEEAHAYSRPACRDRRKNDDGYFYDI